MSEGRTPLRQLLAPLNFVRMDFAGSVMSMWIVPIAVGAITGLLFFLYPTANLAHDRGLLDVSAGLLSMLVGFFVAALGFAISIESKVLDETDNENGPKLNNRAVSWREFTCGITSHLVLVALGTYLLAMLALTFQPAAARFRDDLEPVVRFVFAGVYAFLFAHVVSVTLLAVFLLAVKLPELRKQPPVVVPPVDVANVVLPDESPQRETAEPEDAGKLPPA